SAMSARSSASSSSFWTFLLTVQILTEFSYPGLKFLELLLATLHCQVLCLIQAMLQILNSNLKVLLHPLQVSVSLHLLLDSQGIIPAPDFRIQGALHGVSHPLAVPLDLLHLFIFLCQLPVHLTFNLVELQLDTQDLGLFMFQSSLIIKNNKINLCPQTFHNTFPIFFFFQVEEDIYLSLFKSCLDLRLLCLHLLLGLLQLMDALTSLTDLFSQI
uniref:Uncharacterized protein n=1 Tax=Sparus aurata TaxID=8175 RepID=A0A671VR35_SPAAU